MSIYFEQEKIAGSDNNTDFPDIDIEEIENIIESILFSAGDAVSFSDILDISEDLGLQKSGLKDIIFNFAGNYNGKNTGLEVIILEDNIQLVARAGYIDFIKKVLKSNARQTRSLSKSALEILAVVAYNQPVTKNYIEQMRGVDCAYMLGSLIERGYIEEKGRLDLPGKPYVYGTTLKFLSLFGLSDISKLPDIEKFKNSINAAADGDN
ncbi:MAG: SMC-Scp complex subunit ScpB [Oscillospiraceae bacterium]|nr:SMC-Scp complex subunit ScpB [Oscillospiraceae bacterium]